MERNMHFFGTNACTEASSSRIKKERMKIYKREHFIDTMILVYFFNG